MASYRRGARVVALLALLALAAGIVSDAVDWRFWESHALIAGIVGSSIVDILLVAVLNEAIERRQRRRWEVLAQYVMLQLVYNSRLIWTAVAALSGKMPSGARTVSTLDAGFRFVRDTPSLANAVEALLADSGRRPRLHEELGRFVTSSDEILGRWAGVMLNVAVYAELIDRHVELTNRVTWLDGLLHIVEPVNEGEGHHPISRHLAAAQVDDATGDHLVERIVTITQVAAELDRMTLNVALGMVPIDWWAEQLGAKPEVWTGEPAARSSGAATPATVSSS
jgi:hypothetical protein